MVEMSRHQDRAHSLARFEKQQRQEKENRLLVQLENNRKLLLSRLKAGPASQSSSGSSLSSVSSISSIRSRKGRDKGDPLEPIENFPKSKDQKERFSKSTDRDKSKFSENKSSSTRKFKSQSPSRKIAGKVAEPNKVFNSRRKQERKQEYQHRNPPTQISKIRPVGGGGDKKGKSGQHLPYVTSTIKTASSPTKFDPKPGLVQCRNCSRNFAKERIEVHTNICRKTKNKKRKPFDAAKARVAGTEAAGYRRRGNNISKTKSPAKSDWRKKRAEFISSLRAAKLAQKFLSEGGNVRDLPPPPPSDTSHYIQCQFCGRRFAPNVADRHIPKCKNIESNKTGRNKSRK